MKKTRIISMLLAGLLAVSSLPIVASAAAGDIKVDADLMADATTTATKVTVSENTFLNYYDRHYKHYNPGNSTIGVVEGGIGYMNDFKAGTIYYVAFDARVSNNMATGDEAAALDGGKVENVIMFHNLITNFNIVDITEPNHKDTFTSRWATPTNKVSATKLAATTTQTLKHDDHAVPLSNSSSGYNTVISGEWQYHEFAFVPAADTAKGIISFTKGYDAPFRNAPIDIDNFKVWYYDGDNKVTMISQNFESDDAETSFLNSASNATRPGKFFSTNGGSGYNGNGTFKLATETDYVKVTADANGDANIVYTFDGLTLDSGKYVFSAEARMNFYDGYLVDTSSTEHYHQYYFIKDEDLAANVTISDDLGNSKSVAITNEWSDEIRLTIDIPEGQTADLAAITAAFTDDTTSANKTFELRNVTFTKTTDYVEGEEDNKDMPDVGVIMMMLLKKKGGAGKTVVEKIQLIPNSDLSAAPAIEKGAYDESKGNTWFANAGDGYVKDDKGKDLTDQPIFIDHKIEHVDGYLKFSGRTNNLREFYYNTGVTLEPGTYTLTIDFKTANKGESSSIRVTVPGLFKPTTDDALNINNEWKTMRIPLTVTEPTALKLQFWGGPNAKFKEDFCVDNVSIIVEKTTVVGGDTEKPAEESDKYTGTAPIIISLRTAEDTAKNGVMYQHKDPVTESGVWSYNATELALEVKDAGEHARFYNYRIMPKFAEANQLPAEYKYAVLVYKSTASKWEMKLVNNGTGETTPVSVGKTKANTWMVTDPIDLTMYNNGLHTRYNKPLWGTYCWSTSDKNAVFYVKELAFFTSEKDAKAYYKNLDAYIAATDAALK